MLKLSYDMVAVNQQWFRRSPSGFFAYGDYSNFFRNDYTFLREMTPGIYFPDLRTTTLQWLIPYSEFFLCKAYRLLTLPWVHGTLAMQLWSGTLMQPVCPACRRWIRLFHVLGLGSYLDVRCKILAWLVFQLRYLTWISPTACFAVKSEFLLNLARHFFFF